MIVVYENYKLFDVTKFTFFFLEIKDHLLQT